MTKQAAAFTPGTSGQHIRTVVATLVGAASKKGRVIVWPTARLLSANNGLLAVAATEARPGWRRARRVLKTYSPEEKA